MNDVKLNTLSLVKPARSAASLPSPEPQQTAPVADTAPKQPAGDVSEEQNLTRVSAQQAKEQQQELKEAVTKLNDYVQNVQRDLSFEFDESSGKTVITVVDRKTKEVVRQIPDEIVLKLARNLQQDEPLSLFNMKV